jgi:chaperonin GroEL (HSP60 family)
VFIILQLCADGHDSEAEITLERIRKILAAGANVVLTTKGIDDLCLKEFVEAGAMAVRRCRKEDLRRIARATGGTLISSLADLEGNETYETSYLGTADEVAQERISDDELILIKGTRVVNSASIVLRGANDYMLDEMERALHDTLSVIKRTLESGSVVPGGGAVESALSIYLENFATTLVSLLIGRSAGVSQSFLGLEGAIGNRRVCCRPVVNPQATCGERRKRLNRARRQAPFIPQCGTKCSCR